VLAAVTTIGGSGERRARKGDDGESDGRTHFDIVLVGLRR
jgi:hypothetical protein